MLKNKKMFIYLIDVSTGQGTGRPALDPPLAFISLSKFDQTLKKNMTRY